MQPPYAPAQPGTAPAVAQPAHLSPGPAVAGPVSAIDAVRFVFNDPDWKHNLLFAIVLMVIPIVGPIALSGWLCEVHQRLVRRHPQPMPKIDFADFGHLLGRGVTPFVVNLVTLVPIILIFYALGFGVAFGAIAAGAATNEPLLSIAVGVVGAIVLVFFWCLFAIVLNASMTRAELTEEFGRALSFGEMMGYARDTAGKVIIKTFTFGFVSFGIVLLGILACYIGLYPAIAILQIAGMHLRWQLYEDYLARGGNPIELKPPQWLPSEAQRARY